MAILATALEHPPIATWHRW